jgi:hypothetical protein
MGGTWDWYADDYYTIDPIIDPEGPTSGNYRVYRGGGFMSPAENNRGSMRSAGILPNDVSYTLGFRLAQSNPYSVDGDSDGVFAAFDCDDGDDTLGDITLDPECDGV